MPLQLKITHQLYEGSLIFTKTRELISFYEIMTLFDLWLFCCFWIKTFYYCVWLNNVLSNHFTWPNRFTLNLYTLTSLCIFSILFSIHSQRCWQGEFVSQSNTSYVAGCFLYSHNFNVWFKGDIVRRN